MNESQLHYADVDRGGRLATVYIVGCAVSLIFVGMRLSARCSIAGVGIDDWCMLLTWIVFLPGTVLVSIYSLNGGTRHQTYQLQDPARMEYNLKLNWIAQAFVIFCLGSGKIAVASLIVRLLNRASVWRRWSLYIASIIVAINTLIMITLTFAQCENAEALWDSEVKSRTKCWNPKIQSSFSIYGASFHAAMDFFLALLPITLVWGLKTNPRKKIALCGLLGCGSLTGICAAIKTTQLMSLSARSDLTWETYSLFLWTGIEIILCIVCGSVPALKPIYALCIGRRPGSTRLGGRYTKADSSGSEWRRKRQHKAKCSDADRSFGDEGFGNGRSYGKNYGDGLADGFGDKAVVLAEIKAPELVVLDNGRVVEADAEEDGYGWRRDRERKGFRRSVLGDEEFAGCAKEWPLRS